MLYLFFQHTDHYLLSPDHQVKSNELPDKIGSDHKEFTPVGPVSSRESSPVHGLRTGTSVDQIPNHKTGIDISSGPDHVVGPVSKETVPIDHEHRKESDKSKPHHKPETNDSGGSSLAITTIETITITTTVTDHITLTIYGIEGFDVINSSFAKSDKPESKPHDHHHDHDHVITDNHDIITERTTITDHVNHVEHPVAVEVNKIETIEVSFKN